MTSDCSLKLMRRGNQNKRAQLQLEQNQDTPGNPSHHSNALCIQRLGHQQPSAASPEEPVEKGPLLQKSKGVLRGYTGADAQNQQDLKERLYVLYVCVYLPVLWFVGVRGREGRSGCDRRVG